MPPTEQQRRPAAPRGKPETPWRLIEGDSKRVLKTIELLLDRTGNDTFEVEFRIHRSSRSEKATPPARQRAVPPRRRKPGVFRTLFLRRRK